MRRVIDTSREAVGYRENAREPTLVSANDGRMLIADLPHAQLTSYLDQWARVSS